MIDFGFVFSRQERLAKKGKLDQDDEERMASFIDQQVQRARETAAGAALSEEPEYTELQRDNEDEKLNLDLRLGKWVNRLETWQYSRS